MTRIESTVSTVGNIGKRTEVPPQRRFVVDEPGVQKNRSGVPAANEINPHVAAGLRRQAQEQMQENEHRALQDARRRIELITGLGRKTRDVTVQGMTFTLRTLKAFEQNLLSFVVENSRGVDLENGKKNFSPISLFKIKVEALGHSLYAIDNQPVDIVLGTTNLEYEERVEAKKELILEMDNALIDHLFVQYEQLSQEVYDGYAPKNAKEAEEAVEAIRKSGENA